MFLVYNTDMLHIALIDDKSYGLQQIRDRHAEDEYKLTYFETFGKFQESGKSFDIVYLDYYLDKDGIRGDQVIDKVKEHARKIIGFSSVERCNNIFLDLGADMAILKKENV
jgi:hypothetical protein